jgi:hypothetical protein
MAERSARLLSRGIAQDRSYVSLKVVHGFAQAQDIVDADINKSERRSELRRFPSNLRHHAFEIDLLGLGNGDLWRKAEIRCALEISLRGGIPRSVAPVAA